MTEITPPNEAQVAIASYDRMLAETRKFSAEQNKLAAEARTFDRERWAVYAAAIGGLIGGTAGVVSLIKMLH